MNSKAKGSGGERELCALLQEAGFTEAHRNDQRYVGGKDNPDIALDGYHVEVKRAERFSIYEAMEQAERDASAYTVPIVAHRRNKRPWLVVMRLDDFIRFEKKVNRRMEEPEKILVTRSADYVLRDSGDRAEEA